MPLYPPATSSNPLTCYITYSLATNSNGGTLTGGTYNTRPLNTTAGDTSIVSLSSNQFTLQAGTYHLEGWAVARNVDNNNVRIRNITDSTTAIIGLSTTAAALAVNAGVPSLLAGSFTIAGAKVFELQHYVETTASGAGAGAGANSGDNNIFALVKVVKTA